MAGTDLTLISAAATRTGNEPVTSLDSGGAVEAIALNSYEIIVRNELALNPWKKATKIAELARIDADEEGEPPEPWTAAYQLPDDLVEIRTVKVDGEPIDYEWHGDTILCDAAEDSNVILHYVWRCPESWFPAWLREGIVRRMEAVFLRGIGERYREADARDKAADAQFALARHRDAQSQTPRNPVRSTLLEARRA